tara:strand:+ start:31841 stop:32164 length:324 start_codon:yes stop_codon:yes gene_type:complete
LRARKYINRVEVWQNTATADNYGGNTVTPTQLGSSWANVTTIAIDKMLNYGLDTAKQAITIKTRSRSDINYFAEGIFFKYKGIEWYPTNISNKDFIDEEITIIAFGK